MQDEVNTIDPIAAYFLKGLIEGDKGNMFSSSNSEIKIGSEVVRVSSQRNAKLESEDEKAVPRVSATHMSTSVEIGEDAKDSGHYRTRQRVTNILPIITLDESKSVAENISVKKEQMSSSAINVATEDSKSIEKQAAKIFLPDEAVYVNNAQGASEEDKKLLEKFGIFKTLTVADLAIEKWPSKYSCGSLIAFAPPLSPSETSVTIQCQLCIFRRKFVDSSSLISQIEQHFQENHLQDSKWDGYCATCKRYVCDSQKVGDQPTIRDELNHFKTFHITSQRA